MARSKGDNSSPYQDLDETAFWRTGVAEAGSFPPQNMYVPRFPVTKSMKVLTAGSCFAQHIGNTLKGSGFDVIDTEPVPAKIPNATANKFGYKLYSARYGNIYSVRQFLQLIEESLGRFQPENAIWEKDGRFFDALRPSVEPDGLETPELVRRARDLHLSAVREALNQADLVIFTFGLTEAWQHSGSQTVYPTAPGTIAGSMDADTYSFVNFKFEEIRKDFLAVRRILKSINPDIKFLLTVSPVPLTATASGQHVLPATIHSKSVLRAAVGELYAEFDDIDYFPSYEMIASHPAAGRFFAPNMRTVRRGGVRRVMNAFLTAHDAAPATKSEQRALRRERREQKSQTEQSDLICEEELLEAFQK